MRTGTRLVGAVVLIAALGAPLQADDVPSDRLIAASRLQETGNHREAIALLEEIREIDPRNPKVLYGLALSLYSVGDYREAAHVGETLLAEQKNAPGDLYVIVGSAYGRLRSYEKSEEIFRNGLVAWPTLRRSKSSTRSASKDWAVWTRPWSSSKAASGDRPTMRSYGAR